MDVRTAIDEFLLAVDSEGSSKATIKWYRSVLTIFNKSTQTTLKDITPHKIRLYLTQLRDRPPEKGSKNKTISAETLYTHHRVLNTFFGWCEREYKTKNPMTNIKRPKRPKAKPKAVNPTDAVKMFDAATETRDKLIIAWLTDTGCRVDELCSIRVEDIDFNKLQVLVTGKGNKHRVLMFSPFTRDLLKLYLDSKQDSEYLITGRLTDRMSRWGIARALKRLANKAHVTGRFNPHAFRHGFAREYLMNGGDLGTLSQILGHSSASFTADVYGIFDIADLRKLHLKNSPIRHLETKKPPK